MASVKVFQSCLKTPFLILLPIEICIFFAIIYVASYLRLYSEPESLAEVFDGLWLQAAIIAIVTPITMLATGLYQGQIREGMAGVLIRLTISFVGSGVIVSLLYYLVRDRQEYGY